MPSSSTRISFVPDSATSLCARSRSGAVQAPPSVGPSGVRAVPVGSREARWQHLARRRAARRHRTSDEAPRSTAKATARRASSLSKGGRWMFSTNMKTPGRGRDMELGRVAGARSARTGLGGRLRRGPPAPRCTAVNCRVGGARRQVDHDLVRDAFRLSRLRPDLEVADCGRAGRAGSGCIPRSGTGRCRVSVSSPVAGVPVGTMDANGSASL